MAETKNETTRSLFHQAKAVDNSLTIEKIVKHLNAKGVKSEKDYTRHMVGNVIAGRGNDANITNEIRGIINGSVTVK